MGKEVHNPWGFCGFWCSRAPPLCVCLELGCTMDERKSDVVVEERRGGASTSRGVVSGVSTLSVPSPTLPVAMHNPENVPNSITIEGGMMSIRAQRILSTEVDVNVPNVVAVRGPMFASKTDLTIRAVAAFHKQDMRVLVVRPKTDTRGTSDRLVAHNQCESPKLANPTLWCSRVQAVLKYVRSVRPGPDGKHPIRAVVLDEAQFMEDSVSEWMWELASAISGVVWINGLNTDSNNNLWSAMTGVTDRASVPIMLYAHCSHIVGSRKEGSVEVPVRCGKRANHSRRLVSTDSKVLVGAADKFQPSCTAHFVDVLAHS